jgi:hypothetical protein
METGKLRKSLILYPVTEGRETQKLSPTAARKEELYPGPDMLALQLEPTVISRNWAADHHQRGPEMGISPGPESGHVGALPSSRPQISFATLRGGGRGIQVYVIRL